jgi:hypothetical protein
MQTWERELWSGPDPARLQHGGGTQPEGGRGQQAAPRSPPLPHSVQGGRRSGGSAIRPSAAGRGNTSFGRLALMKTSTGNWVLKLYKRGGGSIVSPELYLIHFTSSNVSCWVLLHVIFDHIVRSKVWTKSINVCRGPCYICKSLYILVSDVSGMLQTVTL